MALYTSGILISGNNFFVREQFPGLWSHFPQVISPQKGSGKQCLCPRGLRRRPGIRRQRHDDRLREASRGPENEQLRAVLAQLDKHLYQLATC